jgi:hypothetical protein
MAGYAAGLFSGGGRTSRTAADLADRVSDRLANTIPEEQGDMRHLAAGGTLISQGCSESRLKAFGNQTRRFLQFCELDGYDWECASRHAVVARLAYL